MRPGRLAMLLGTLLATAALYLKHLVVDGAAFRAVTGVGTPTIWQELGKWGRPAAALLAAALVAAAFRPGSGAFDRWGAVAGLLLAAGAVAGGILARQSAAHDSAALSTALQQAGSAASGASPGLGFWVLLAGAGVVLAGAAWDLIDTRRGESGERPGGAPSIGEQDPAAL